MPDPFCVSYIGADGELNLELFQSSVDCIKLIDLDGRVCLLNAGGVVALQLDGAEQIQGSIWWEFWPEEGRELASSAFEKARHGEVNHFQAFCPTARGAPRWWHAVASPVADAHGIIRKIMVVSRDISDLVLARQALDAADLRKNAFLATVAHELRNPLSATFSAAELLKSHAFDHRRTVELASLIQRQVRHMSRIAEDLLDSSRVGRGEISLKSDRINMHAVLTESAEQLRTAMTSKAQTFTIALCEDACPVKGDHTRLLQVAGNLLGNATRYTPDGGDIRLQLQRVGNMVEFSVIDSGIGISSERMSTIFDVYSQVDKTGTSKGKGLGIGLSLVRAFVNLHGGTVHAASRGANLGSQFTVTLPAVPD